MGHSSAAGIIKPTLVDTDILSLFFRGNPAVVARFAEYAEEHGSIAIAVITYYEVLSGLLHRDARRQFEAFQRFVVTNRVLPLHEEAAAHAADFYAKTRKAGQPVDDIDLLIAGIAVANGLAVATRNTAHFTMIPGLDVQDWSV